MQKVPANDKRKLLPRWRPLARVPNVELASTSHPRLSWPDFQPEILTTSRRWEGGKSHEAGVELLEAALTLSEREIGADVARALIASNDLRPLGRKFADQLVTGPEVSDRDHAEQIRDGKKLLNLYPRNGVLRSQMALSYISMGQRKQASEQIEAAVASAPQNRFVLRSAARFYVHDGNPEGALWAVQRAERTDDPWILATQTALADLVRSSAVISGRDIRMLLNADMHPSQLVELAIAFATLEIAHGAIKPARKLINRFRSHLNENTAAQIKWIEEYSRIGFDIDVHAVKDSFEASALLYHNSSEWGRAIAMAERWFLDEPFSTRPAIMGSYIASAYENQNERSIKLIDRALTANPADVGLMNNKAFALSQLGKMTEAWKWLNRAKTQPLDNDTKVVLQATEANIRIRQGQVFLGLQQYAEAAKNAVEGGLLETRDRMIVHWLKEMYLHRYTLEEQTLQKFISHYKENGGSSPEGRRLFNHVAAPVIEMSIKSNPDSSRFLLNEEGLFLYSPEN